MATAEKQDRQLDGRPLYAYKWCESEYERLKDKVRNQMPQVLRGREAPGFAAMFCTYAAETFRRRHAGGPWTWETVFAEIAHPTPDYPSLYVWVEKGLRYFRRPLLRSRRGDREFLFTLACEGGLPLQLLHQENAHLSRYFRELLTVYHRERRLPGCDATDIARQVAVRYLPTSLRHDVVFKLSGDLIQAIVELQKKVPDAMDPIPSLDLAQPQWREQLPLPVEDATVEALLKNLVSQAKTLEQTTQQRWRWRCLLVRQGEHWSIAQRLELPNTVTGATLQTWSGWNDPPARLRVLLQTTEGIETIVLLTRLQGTGEQAVYRCEELRRGGVLLQGQAAMTSVRLLLSNGSEEVELPALGGYEVGPLPWVFVARGAQWEWLGEGSVRSRDAVARVLVSEGGHCLADNGTWEALGRAPDLQRFLYEMTGTVEWQHPDLDACQIRCASQDASEESFLLRGNRLLTGLNLPSPFLGMPRLYAMGRDEEPRRIHDATLEWRPLGAPENAWRTDAAACAGRVWIRYRDADGVRFRRQVEVTPATTRMEIARVGARPSEAGIIRLTGLPAGRVTVPEREGCDFRIRPVADGTAIDCFAQAGLPITQFHADVQWLDGRSLLLLLPFPRQGAAFVRAGQTLPSRERVALGRLAAIQAVIHTPAGGGRFSLEGSVRTRISGNSQQVLRESLRPTSNEPLHFVLHRLQERLAAMLAMTGDLDAVVDLNIVDGDGHTLAHLEVAQFDVALEPDREHNRVVLPSGSLERLDDGWEERLTVKMLPLWEPATEPTDLIRDETTHAWQIPAEVAPGPWWVLGMDGAWARFRPLLWVVQGDKDLAEASELVQAIREPVRATRQTRLQALVHTLATNAEHPDWLRLVDYLRLTRTYPASAFDLLQHLVHSPEAIILMLIKSTDEEFDLVWALADQMPFSWHLLPVSQWRQAAQHYFGALRTALADSDPAGDMLWGIFREFRQRLTSRQPFFKSVCDWLGEHLFPARQLENNELALARSNESFLTALLQEHEQDLQARHDAEEHYPDGPLVMERITPPDFPESFRYARRSYPYRPVRCAPFVAAQISLQAEESSEEFLLELRQLRDFDPVWFDNAFALALCLGLARCPVHVEGAPV